MAVSGRALFDAVAVGHLGAVPERVVVGVAVVDAAARARTVVPDAGAAVGALVVVERRLRTPLRVRGGGLAAARRARAPDVVGVGELGARAAGRAVEVGRVVAEAVAQLPGAGGARGVEGDRTGVLRVAGPLLDGLGRVEDPTGAGVDPGLQAAGRLARADAGRRHLPRQARCALARVDDEVSGAGVDLVAGRLRGGGSRGRAAHGHRRRGGGDSLAAVPVAVLHGAVRALGHDEVTPDDRQAVDRAVVPHVTGAVGVGEHAAHDERLVGRQPQCLAGGRGGGLLGGLEGGVAPGRGGGSGAARNGGRGSRDRDGEGCSGEVTLRHGTPLV